MDTPGRVETRRRAGKPPWRPRQSGSTEMKKESLVYGEACEQRFQERKESHGSQTVQADQPRPALPDGLGTSPRSRRTSRRSRCSLRSRTRRGATTTAASPRAIRAAATSAVTASSTSSATRTACPPRSPPSSTTRTVPRAHRASPLRRRREALHPASEGPARWRHGHERPRGRHQAGQRPAARVHPRRHPRACRRAAAGQGRGHRAFGRHQHPAHGQGGQVRHPAHAVFEMRRVLLTCRATVGEVGNANTPTSRSARPAATAGRASVPPSAAPS